mgnify:CR=1 FL=1
MVRLKSLIASNISIKLIEKRASIIISPSEAEKKIISAYGIRPTKVYVIRNFVPDEYFKFKPRDEILEKCGLGPYEYIISVSRIDYNKSLDQAIKALANLRKHGIKATYVMIGPDEGALSYYLELASSIGVRNHVVYLGVIRKEKEKLF